MHGFPERLVGRGEQDADEEEDEDRSPADPAEGDESGEDAALAVLLAEEEFAPYVLMEARGKFRA